jgi:outer membrane biosynthesis protein TonB
LIGAVQSWRFKPAMQNGVPVTSRFTVDINVE